MGWLAYQSTESDRGEIYVRPFPNVNDGRWQVSTGGGTRPLWARKGNELFYLTPDGEALMSVPISGGAAFKAGNPKRCSRRGCTTPRQPHPESEPSLAGHTTCLPTDAGS